MIARVLTLALVLAAAAATQASAAPLGLGDCGPAEGVYQCSGLVRSWDGVPLDTTLTLPDSEARELPLVVELHGLGNSKYEYLNPAEGSYTDNAFAWARRGYAALTYTARGFWGSCGAPESRLASPVDCSRGYIHLADVRYEVRDTQELIGRLVDEGVTDQGRIGVTGDSYGGGQSLMLAALRNRVMLPDGQLVPWRSPAGTPLQIAAAAPVIPWSDLVYAAAPNGRVFTHAITPRSLSTSPVGVEKATVVNAIFAATTVAIGPGQPVGEPFVPGRPIGYLAPPGVDPSADVAGWVARTDRGEPYTDPEAQAIVAQLANFHSAYHIPPGRPPPLFLAAGFTDDLFPADEVVRFANRTRARYPHAPLAMMLGDFGHQRAANKVAERAQLTSSIHRWFDHYLRGQGRGPRAGVSAFMQTCPRSQPPGRRFFAPTFTKLARGEVRIRSVGPQTLGSDGGDPATGAAIDPAAGMGDGCAEVDAQRAPGTAVYELEVPADRRYTLIGSPTAIARLSLRGAAPDVAQVASRLWDVSPEGRQRLVARGLYRPTGGARDVWQLHPNAWKFAPGHTLKLELLGNDAPYGRPSNGDFEIDVERLRLRLPIRQRSARGSIRKPSRLPLLPGQKRAR